MLSPNFMQTFHCLQSDLKICLSYLTSLILLAIIPLKLYSYFSRHVLRLMITAPLGYNVNLSSCHPFHFGDENIIMQELTSVSFFSSK